LGGGRRFDIAFTPGTFFVIQLSWSSASKAALTAVPDLTPEHEDIRGRHTKAAIATTSLIFMEKFPCSQWVDARQPLRGELISLILCDNKHFMVAMNKIFENS
jgi:hypothetical protein